MEKNGTIFHPIISSIQKMALYETKSKFYLVGSNNTQTRFRVLKIDRMESRTLEVYDDKVEYTAEEIHDLVNMIDSGNRRAGSGGLSKVISAFGIVGFIKFLEGYYIILITKRRRVAVIGHHTIYKIEDSNMIYIPHDSVRIIHPDEPRYVKMFQNIDLASNFYFSYSYDLTHSLQHNLTTPKRIHMNMDNTGSSLETDHNIPDDSTALLAASVISQGLKSEFEGTQHYGIRTQPNRKFVWNTHLLKEAITMELHPDWILYITHGFIGQSNINIFVISVIHTYYLLYSDPDCRICGENEGVCYHIICECEGLQDLRLHRFGVHQVLPEECRSIPMRDLIAFADATGLFNGKSVYVTLIARRSCKYAGTRFLKRGANFQGDVANEVETEQMVHDSAISSFSNSHFTSFVQMRGSIPGHWKQEMGKMVAKPAITIDFYDPFAETAGAHFNELLKRYGAPIIILNLVKQRERKRQERLLSDELSSAVKYLNQFLPVEHQIIYKTFDMARKNKGINANVMRHLAVIAKNAVMKVGIFHNKPKLFTQKSNTVVGQSTSTTQPEYGSRQTGIIRTNCVDCLDRTNTAQFAIGKCVLGYQLCALGVLDTPDLEFDTDCVRMLESLYEDHGDTLALQYGGSQLVHRIKTYRKTAPWTSQGNDIMQTLSRYYSNTFSDAEKQNAINLFLGLFKPEENQPQIWDYTTDYYFHHKPIIYSLRSLTQWWDPGVLKSLPYAYNDLTKACSELIQVHSRDVEMIDSYLDYYRPYELSMLDDVFALKISNSIRDFMPHFTINYSPFTIRVRPVRRREENSNSKANNMKNPSVTGQSSTSSAASSTSSSSGSEDSSDDEETVDSSESQKTLSKENSPEPVTFKALFPSTKEVYGFELKKPSPEDVLKYKKYVLMGKRANGTALNIFNANMPMKPISNFSKDTCFEVTSPKVSQKSIEIYERYIELGKNGGFKPSTKDIEIYQKYASLK